MKIKRGPITLFRQLCVDPRLGCGVHVVDSLIGTVKFENSFCPMHEGPESVPLVNGVAAVIFPILEKVRMADRDIAPVFKVRQFHVDSYS